jgi:TatA/E family protein of Tat protein translocase
MGLFSPEHVLLVVLVVALLFGARGVPGLARRAGKGIRETRDALGIDEIRHEVTGVRDTLRPASQAGDAAQQPAAPAQRAEDTQG